MNTEPSYAELARQALVDQLPESCDGRLIDLYVLLVLTKGAATAMSDVHDAWTIWVGGLGEHRSSIPFEQLTEDVRELDRPWLDAIHRTAGVGMNDG